MKKSLAVLAMVAIGGLAPQLATQDCLAGGWHSQPAAVSYATLAKGNDGVWGTPKLVIATSPQEWNRAMSEMELQGELIGPAPALPEVNWHRELVVLVTVGLVASDAYSISVADVRRAMDVGYVHVEVTKSPATSSQSTCSYHMVRVERRGLRRIEAQYEYEEVTGGETGLSALVNTLAEMSSGAGLLAHAGSEDEEAAAPQARLVSSWGAVKGLYR